MTGPQRWWHEGPDERRDASSPVPGPAAFYWANCGMCRVWYGDAQRPETIEPNPACQVHGHRPPPSLTPSSSANSTTVVTLLIVFAILAGLYVVFHAYKYHGCLITPGIFDWPSYCI